MGDASKLWRYAIRTTALEMHAGVSVQLRRSSNSVFLDSQWPPQILTHCKSAGISRCKGVSLRCTIYAVTAVIRYCTPPQHVMQLSTKREMRLSTFVAHLQHLVSKLDLTHRLMSSLALIIVRYCERRAGNCTRGEKSKSLHPSMSTCHRTGNPALCTH